ncbi:hypothetical protein SUGI_0984170 [Cryptomeria japonica]|uniref:transcription initiation factor IIF subunit alpha isoform X2 n=1 Tax=Cryptomeria japonica TaxID=3369 RepID=UPI002414B992|nr:transcription initiation factor IIF subunit alpha isoform X2 [Cryptomeria japonica]GLJ46683.1 hypothetical protein SUGI_0984170 [Cryptomeria japonica]
MECMKDGVKCTSCDSNKDLYASQCTHIDPICLTCATSMAKNNSTCQTCGHLIRKVIRRYDLKACLAKEPEKFICKFPVNANRPDNKGGGNGDVKSTAETKFFRKSDKGKWSMYRKAAAKSKMKGDNEWILEHALNEKLCYTGKKQSDPKGYYMVLFDGKRMNEGFVVYPIKYWYDFQKNIHYDTLTIEEAENQMNDQKRNQEGFARWLMKDKQDKVERGVKTRLTIGEDDEDDERDVEWDDVLDNEETKKKTINKNEDSEEEAGDDEKFHPNDDVDEDQDKDKGEEWEHEKEYADDDEQIQDNSHNTSKEDESSESALDDNSDFEDDEGITEAGKQIKMLLKKKFDENDESGKENALEPSANNKEINENDSEHEDVKMVDAQIKLLPTKNATRERREKKRKVVDDGSSKSDSTVMKKSKPSFSLQDICVEFLQSGPKNVNEMHAFLKEQKKRGSRQDELKSIMKRIAQQRNGIFTLRK